MEQILMNDTLHDRAIKVLTNELELAETGGNRTFIGEAKHILYGYEMIELLSMDEVGDWEQRILEASMQMSRAYQIGHNIMTASEEH